LTAIPGRPWKKLSSIVGEVPKVRGEGFFQGEERVKAGISGFQGEMKELAWLRQKGRFLEVVRELKERRSYPLRVTPWTFVATREGGKVRPFLSWAGQPRGAKRPEECKKEKGGWRDPFLYNSITEKSML